MALVKCKECNKEISDQAKVCPNCGAPTESLKQKKETNHKIIFTIAGVAVIIIVIVAVIFGIKSNQKSYIYGNQAINILKDYKDRKLTEDETYKQLDQLYDDIEKAISEIDDSSNEYSRLLGIKIGVSGAQIDIRYDGLSQSEIDEKIDYIKGQMN